MSILLFLVALVYICWVWFGRAWYFAFTYGEVQAIKAPKSMTKQELFSLLKTQFSYPELNDINYNEKGNIYISAKHGIHEIVVKDCDIFVQRTIADDKRNRRMLYTEEALCLEKYIEKLFNPNEPTTPYESVQRKNKFEKQNVLVKIVVIILLICLAVYFVYDTGIWYSISSDGISDQYLSSYSNVVTIGEAFKDFFGNPKWDYYENGSLTYITFAGKCMFDGSEANATILFESTGDQFRITQIKINGQDIGFLFYDEFLSTVYSQGDNYTVAD